MSKPKSGESQVSVNRPANNPVHAIPLNFKLKPSQEKGKKRKGGNNEIEINEPFFNSSQTLFFCPQVSLKDAAEERRGDRQTRREESRNEMFHSCLFR